jgi:hypothetical protein
MAKSWAEVSSSPEFQALTPDQQESARQQYFQQVVAPQVADPSQLQVVKQQFDAQTGPKTSSATPFDQAVQQQVKAYQAQDDQDKANPVNGMRPGDVLMGSIGAGMTNAVNGLQQVGAQIVSKFPGSLGAKGAAEYQALKDQQDEKNKIDAPLLNTTLGKIGYYGEKGLEMLTPGTDATEGLSLLRGAAPYAAAALKGGALAGAQPVQNGESRLNNALAGAAWGAGGQAVSSGLRALAGAASDAIPPIKQAAINVANKYNIPLHLSQVTDSKFLQTLASAAKYLPFSGSGAAKSAQQGAFNRALAGQIGQNSDTLSDQVLANAAQDIGNRYNDLFGRNTISLNGSDASKLTDIINNATKFGGSDVGKIIGNHVDTIVNNLDQNGSMPGRLYQAIRTDQLLPAEQSANPALGQYLRQVRGVLQDAANRSIGPQDAAELSNLNGQYNSLKILQKAINNRAAGAGGDVSPANLWSLVNGKYGSTPQMRELAQLGQTVLKDPIPDSGTAGRNISYATLGAGVAMPHTILAPVIGGATVGRALNSPLAAKLLPAAYRGTTQLLAGLASPLPNLLPLLADAPPLGVGSQPVRAVASP